LKQKMIIAIKPAPYETILSNHLKTTDLPAFQILKKERHIFLPVRPLFSRKDRSF